MFGERCLSQFSAQLSDCWLFYDENGSQEPSSSYSADAHCFLGWYCDMKRPVVPTSYVIFMTFGLEAS